MNFHRGDLVECLGERWTVSEDTASSGPVALCRTDLGGPPLGRTTEAPAGQVRLVARAAERSLGKGADIDYIRDEARR